MTTPELTVEEDISESIGIDPFFIVEVYFQEQAELINSKDRIPVWSKLEKEYFRLPSLIKERKDKGEEFSEQLEDFKLLTITLSGVIELNDKAKERLAKIVKRLD